LALGGHCLVIRHNNQPIVGGSDRRDDEEDARPGWSVWGGCFSYFGAVNRTTKKITKIMYNEGLRWPPFAILHTTTNQKHASMTEGGWDRPHDCARTLGERDGNDEPLAEGANNDNNEYGVNGNIPDDDNKYAVQVDGVNKPLDKGDDKCATLSAAPAQACPESQQPSVPSR
jgi:hypothetical protein